MRCASEQEIRDFHKRACLFMVYHPGRLTHKHRRNVLLESSHSSQLRYAYRIPVPTAVLVAHSGDCPDYSQSTLPLVSLLSMLTFRRSSFHTLASDPYHHMRDTRVLSPDPKTSVYVDFHPGICPLLAHCNVSPVSPSSMRGILLYPPPDRAPNGSASLRAINSSTVCHSASFVQKCIT